MRVLRLLLRQQSKGLHTAPASVSFVPFESSLDSQHAAAHRPKKTRSSWLDAAAQRRDLHQSEEGAQSSSKPVYVPLWRFDGYLSTKIQGTLGHTKLEMTMDQKTNQLVNKVNVVWTKRSTERHMSLCGSRRRLQFTATTRYTDEDLADLKGPHVLRAVGALTLETQPPDGVEMLNVNRSQEEALMAVKETLSEQVYWSAHAVLKEAYSAAYCKSVQVHISYDALRATIVYVPAWRVGKSPSRLILAVPPVSEIDGEKVLQARVFNAANWLSSWVGGNAKISEQHQQRRHHLSAVAEVEAMGQEIAEEQVWRAEKAAFLEEQINPNKVAWEEERRAERSERARQARLFGERFVYSSREYREEKERAEAHRTRPRIQFCTAGNLSLYDLLKVAPDATVEEIKTSFRSLAMSCHPDKFPDQDAKAKASLQFKKLVAAYQTLRDPQKRKQYDVYGESDK